VAAATAAAATAAARLMNSRRRALFVVPRAREWSPGSKSLTVLDKAFIFDINYVSVLIHQKKRPR